MNTPLGHLLETPVRRDLVEFFMKRYSKGKHRDKAVSKKQIVRELGVSKKAVREQLDVLIDLGVVSRKFREERYEKYYPNTESGVPALLIKLDKTVQNGRVTDLYETPTRGEMMQNFLISYDVQYDGTSRWTTTELIDNVGATRGTVLEAIDELMKLGVLTEKKIAGETVYQLQTDNEIFETILDLNDRIIDEVEKEPEAAD